MYDVMRPHPQRAVPWRQAPTLDRTDARTRMRARKICQYSQNRGDEKLKMATRGEVLDFSCDQLYVWLVTELKDEVGDETIEELRFQRINGKAFLELTDDDLRELVPLIGERKAIQRRIHSFKPKVFSTSTGSITIKILVRAA